MVAIICREISTHPFSVHPHKHALEEIKCCKFYEQTLSILVSIIICLRRGGARSPRWVSVVHKGTWPCLARAAACLALDRLRGRRRETLGLAADDHAFQGARSFACYHIFVQRNIVVGKARLRLAHLFGACCCRLRCSSIPSAAQARGRSRRAPHRASCSAASLPASLPLTHAASRRRRHVPLPGRA